MLCDVKAPILTTPQSILECVRDVAPKFFNSCVNHVLGRMSENSGCVVSFATVWITYLDFADALKFAETTDILAKALESLREEAKLLVLRVCWIKTKMQAFGDMQEATTESVSVGGENAELIQTFTYIGSVIHSSTSCGLEVNRRLGRARSAMTSLDEVVWHCRYLCERTKA